MKVTHKCIFSCLKNAKIQYLMKEDWNQKRWLIKSPWYILIGLCVICINWPHHGLHKCNPSPCNKVDVQQKDTNSKEQKKLFVISPITIGKMYVLVGEWAQFKIRSFKLTLCLCIKIWWWWMKILNRIHQTVVVQEDNNFCKNFLCWIDIPYTGQARERRAHKIKPFVRLLFSCFIRLLCKNQLSLKKNIKVQGHKKTHTHA